MSDSINHKPQRAENSLGNIRKFLPASLTLTSCLLFVSCGTIDTAKNFAKKSVGSVAKLVPSRIPVTEVRKQDLKELPTGAEKALAYQRQLDRKRYASINYFVPGDYTPPALPDIRDMSSSGSILPPLNSDQQSTD